MAFPFAGLKKQLNKANQYMSERISGVEGTKLNNEFQVGKTYFYSNLNLLIERNIL